MFAKVTYKLTDFWIKSFTHVKVLGPIPVNSANYHRVLAFRALQNQLRAPYLEEKHQVEIENKLLIDERSLHFALERAGQIVACVRLTPLPFEFSALATSFEERSSEFENYFEFGRLCTDSSLDRKGFHAGILVVKAAHHLFMKEKAKGVVGICKTDRVSYMQKLGMRIDPEAVRINARQSDYHLIHASKDELLSFYFKRFFGLFASKQKNSPDMIVSTQSIFSEKNHEPRPTQKSPRSRIWQTS